MRSRPQYEPQPGEFVPAPCWRRLGAAIYDGIIFVALVTVAVMVAVTVTVVFDLKHGTAWRAGLRASAVLIGLAYFGWFWTHGGQTLGLRAWRLRLTRRCGAPPSWGTAAARYAWALAPLLIGLWRASSVHGIATVPVLLAAALGPYVPCFVDPRKRALADLLAGTELALVPSASAVHVQPPGRDQRQQSRGRTGREHR